MVIRFHTDLHELLCIAGQTVQNTISMSTVVILHAEKIIAVVVVE
jgi:hypothetical protein